MIVFDLECSNGHKFEGWFKSSESFDEQFQKGLLTCPECGDTDIKRLLSPVRTTRARPDEQGAKDKKDSIDYKKLAKEVINYINKNFEYVGTNFAKEALKMHYGVSEKRNIRGSATADEEEMLKKEGIDFFKLPFELPKDDEDKN